MTSMARWGGILPALPVHAVANLELRRIVARKALESRTPADLLYTSGRPGRYNPRGVFCLYASEDAATAGAEFERYWSGQPLASTLYFCRITASLLDLGSPHVLAALGLREANLFDSWRTTLSPTATQRLGAAIAAQNRFAGIRFPSDAARERGFAGWNYVLYRDAVVAPASVVVVDDAGVTVQAWPVASRLKLPRKKRSPRSPGHKRKSI